MRREFVILTPGSSPLMWRGVTKLSFTLFLSLTSLSTAVERVHCFEQGG